jgi:hypothetical protein
MKRQDLLNVPVILGAAAFATLIAGPADAQGRSARDIPYATSFLVTVNNGSGTNGYSPDAVPSSKRLVIEFVSVTVVAQPGEKPSLYLNDSVNGVGHAYWIPLTLAETAASGAEVYRASQLVRLNHDGNGTNGPGAQCLRNVNGFNSMSCQLTISGYLVDK